MDRHATLVNCDYHTYDNRQLLEDFGIKMTAWEDCVKDTVDYYNTLSWSEPIYGMSELIRRGLIEELN